MAKFDERKYKYVIRRKETNMTLFKVVFVVKCFCFVTRNVSKCLNLFIYILDYAKEVIDLIFPNFFFC